MQQNDAPGPHRPGLVEERVVRSQRHGGQRRGLGRRQRIGQPKELAARHLDASRVSAEHCHSKNGLARHELLRAPRPNALDNTGELEPGHDWEAHKLFGTLVEAPPNADVGVVDAAVADINDDACARSEPRSAWPGSVQA